MDTQDLGDTPKSRANQPSNPLEAFHAAWGAYAADVNATGAELRPTLETAYKAYMRAAQDALRSSDAQTKLADVWQQYWRAIEDGLKELGLESRLGAAYLNYVDALKKAWASADPKALTPACLSCIAYTMLWAAYWRCSGIGHWWLAGVWGWNPNYVLFGRTVAASEAAPSES
jgi:hypothetical protein